MATTAQVNFIKRLIEEKDITGTAFSAWTDEVFNTVSTRDASNAIDMLKRLPRKQVATVAQAEPLTAGMYRVGDDIFKVQVAVHGSGNLYAKRLVVNGVGEKASFEYAPGVVRTLTQADRMSLEDAKAFGALYGTCCVCGRVLTNEVSIEAGIGPVCSGRL